MLQGSTPPTPAPGGVVAPAASTAAGVSKVRDEADARQKARRLMVRAFVRAFLSPGPTFMNATQSYFTIAPEVAEKTAWNAGSEMLREEDVKEEMARQIRAIDKAADMDDQWVYDRWRMIANANLFDYITIRADGTADVSKLNTHDLTVEQQQCIRKIRFDGKTGRVTSIELASIDQAVANVARARQMIDGKRDPSQVDLAQRITERMQRAQKRTGRTYDNDTGERIA